jgi:hypothetical protein
MLDHECIAGQARYVRICRKRGLDPVEQEQALLGIAKEFLPECALAVLAGETATAEYWAWVLDQMEE